jgi:hypothetical protein
MNITERRSVNDILINSSSGRSFRKAAARSPHANSDRFIILQKPRPFLICQNAHKRIALAQSLSLVIFLRENRQHVFDAVVFQDVFPLPQRQWPGASNLLPMPEIGAGDLHQLGPAANFRRNPPGHGKIARIHPLMAVPVKRMLLQQGIRVCFALSNRFHRCQNATFPGHRPTNFALASTFL